MWESLRLTFSTRYWIDPFQGEYNFEWTCWIWWNKNGIQRHGCVERRLSRALPRITCLLAGGGKPSWELLGKGPFLLLSFLLILGLLCELLYSCSHHLRRHVGQVSQVFELFPFEVWKLNLLYLLYLKSIQLSLFYSLSLPVPLWLFGLSCSVWHYMWPSYPGNNKRV